MYFDPADVLRRDAHFASKMFVTPACWIWRGAVNKHGRAVVQRGGREQIAIRYAWELMFGPLPPGLRLLRHCGGRRALRTA